MQAHGHDAVELLRGQRKVLSPVVLRGRDLRVSVSRRLLVPVLFISMVRLVLWRKQGGALDEGRLLVVEGEGDLEALAGPQGDVPGGVEADEEVPLAPGLLGERAEELVDAALLGEEPVVVELVGLEGGGGVEGVHLVQLAAEVARDERGGGHGAAEELVVLGADAAVEAVADDGEVGDQDVLGGVQVVFHCKW